MALEKEKGKAHTYHIQLDKPVADIWVTVETQEPEKRSPPVTLEIVKSGFTPEALTLLEMWELENKIHVKTKGWIAKETWQKFNEKLKGLDAKWVSAGESSHWEIAKG